MKKFLVLLSILFGGFAFAQTETINWYKDGQIYTTTTCETGGDITLPTAPTKYGYTFQGWRDYTQIEYLESTGTQWIDTGVILNENSKIIVKFLRTDISSFGVIGMRQDYTRNNISVTCGANNSGRMVVDFNNGNYGGYRAEMYAYNVATDGIVVAELSKYGRIIFNAENTVLASNTNLNSQNFNMQKNALMFNVSGEDTNPLIGRIYYAKIWNNDILIRDFIPVIDGNNIPCMYDRVEGKFYYNVNTDNFIAGPVIDE